MDGIIIRDLDVFMIQQYQQNRYPCLFIDYVCELVPGKFAKGYWLRNPMGDSGNYDTGYAYVVDIVNGNIHPAAVKPLAETGNEELDTTTPYGIRLAFTMPQDR